jgi:hypothetical protein
MESPALLAHPLRDPNRQGGSGEPPLPHVQARSVISYMRGPQAAPAAAGLPLVLLTADLRA